jgi:hypothetical protein
MRPTSGWIATSKVAQGDPLGNGDFRAKLIPNDDGKARRKGNGLPRPLQSWVVKLGYGMRLDSDRILLGVRV